MPNEFSLPPAGRAASRAVAFGGEARRPFHEIADLQEAQVVARIVSPFLDRPADDAATVVPHAAALDLAPQDRAAHEGRGVAAGVANEHPAGRLVADAVAGEMRLRLGAVDQGEIAEIAAAADVDLEGERLAMDDPLERDELRPGEKVVHDARGGAQALRHFGVAGAGLIADAGDEAARGLLAEALDQLLPQGAERGHVHQHHALVVEPDAAMAGSETKAVGEIVDLGNADR